MAKIVKGGKLFFFIEEFLIYNAVLTSGGLKLIQLHIYIRFCVFFSIRVYHRILNTFPYTIL